MNGRVLVFGTFDNLHPGHLFFLKQAKREGNFLFVSVARDEHVEILKNKKTKANEQQRLKAVQALDFVDHAELSDKELGSFELIKKFDPEIIAIGFDQNDLENAIKIWIEKNKQTVKFKKISVTLCRLKELG